MIQKNPLFILFGNGPLQNRGCEAILRSTIDLLQDEFGPCRFVNSLPYPNTFDNTVNLPAEVIHQVPEPAKKEDLRRFRLSWFKHQFKKRFCPPPKELFEGYLDEAAAMLCLGGDNFTLDYGYPERYFMANRAVFRHGKPVVIWGASVGPFSERRRFERYAIRELKKVSLICAREPETVRYLAGIGIEDNVRQITDPAFALKPVPVTDDSTLLKMTEQPCIGANFSPMMARYCTQGQCWKDCVCECIQMLLEQQDLPIVLIPHVFLPDNNDYDFMRTIVQKLDVPKDRLYLVGPEYNAQQLKWIISQMSLFMGCRTHSTIAALSSHVPTLSIGYSMKAGGINQDIFGNADWIIPVNALNPACLCEKTRSLLDAQTEIRDYLENVMPSYKRNARQAATYLRNLFEFTL